jgi:hypothetical protein
MIKKFSVLFLSFSHLCPASLGVDQLPDLDPVAPPLFKEPDPVLSKAVTFPPGLHVVFNTTGLDQVLKLLFPHGVIEVRTHLEALYEGLLHCHGQLL